MLSAKYDAAVPTEALGTSWLLRNSRLFSGIAATWHKCN